MKRKQLVLLIVGLVVAVGSAWVGRATYRAWHGLITLHVRNAPLEDVIRKIEHQTWEKIRYDDGLKTLVTLDVKDMPLPQVLDRLAEQIGANWSTDLVVYDSSSALRKLESVFKGQTTLDAAGWTNLSGVQPLDLGAGGGEETETNSDGAVIRQSNKLDGHQLDEAEIRRQIEKQLPAGANVSIGSEEHVLTAIKQALKDGPTEGGKVAITRSSKPDASNNLGFMVKRFAPSNHVMMRTPDGRIQSLPEGLLAPERLLTETRLTPKLDLTAPLRPSMETAANTAKKAHASWTIYYTLRKLPFGMNVRLFQHDAEMTAGQVGAPGRIEDFQATMKNHVQQQKQDYFTKLTPEQRAERARGTQAFKQQISVQP